jgi:hypothetical protein
LKPVLQNSGHNPITLKCRYNPTVDRILRRLYTFSPWQGKMDSFLLSNPLCIPILNQEAA